MRENHFLDSFGHLEDLEKSSSSLVPFVVAFLATAFLGSVEHELVWFADVFSYATENLSPDAVIRFVGDLAVTTEFASQTL